MKKKTRRVFDFVSGVLTTIAILLILGSMLAWFWCKDWLSISLLFASIFIVFIAIFLWEYKVD